MVSREKSSWCLDLMNFVFQCNCKSSLLISPSYFVKFFGMLVSKTYYNDYANMDLKDFSE